jgi:hypothetical protein
VFQRLRQSLSSPHLAVCIVTLFFTSNLCAQSERVGLGLRIVIVEGEDAVNIIQQKTAVTPVVEVRDQNNQPIAGVAVRFVITKGRATFNGARTVSMMTNAAGRAAASGFAPTGAGALQISATAAFQGQTAVAAIVQTNVMTAAEAAAVSSAGAASGGGAGASGAGAGGAAGGGAGGGLSATTVAVVGGAAAGGTLAAKQVLGGSSLTHYQGTFSGPFRIVANAQCTFNIAEAGTVSVDIEVSDSGAVSGRGRVEDSHTFLTSCNPAIAPNSVANHGDGGPVTGSKNNLAFTGSHPGLDGSVYRYDFSGMFNGAEIDGAYTLTVSQPGGGGTATFPVILR